MSNPQSPGTQTPSHPSLPARPPPSAVGNGGYVTFFKPRSVAGPRAPSYSAQPTYSNAYTAPAPTYPQPSPQFPSYPTPPQITNPFPTPFQPPPTGLNGRFGSGLSQEDQEEQARIAQWQSAYAGNNEQSNKPTGNPNAQPLGPNKLDTSATQNVEEKKKTVIRHAGGQTWTDPTLMEWDPSHFRLFVGNLAGEVSDDTLLKAFQKYGSTQKARVVRDKKTTKSKGYGFVSFKSMDDYSKAAKEMQGKYIGSHPVILRAAKTAVKPTDKPVKNDKNKKKGGKGEISQSGGPKAGGGGAVLNGGVKKSKKGNSMRLLG